MKSCSEHEHMVSPVDSAPQNGEPDGTSHSPGAETAGGSENPKPQDISASVEESSPSQGAVVDGDEAAPFSAHADGNEGVLTQQEPTLAHCVEVTEPSVPARSSVIASIRVQQGGGLQQIQEEFDASFTAADIQHKLADKLKVNPGDLQLTVCGKELSGAISLSTCPRDDEGCIAIDALATVASQSINLEAPKPAPAHSMVRMTLKRVLWCILIATVFWC